jgi:hypothetical protein
MDCDSWSFGSKLGFYCEGMMMLENLGDQYGCWQLIKQGITMGLN